MLWNSGTTFKELDECQTCTTMEDIHFLEYKNVNWILSIFMWNWKTNKNRSLNDWRKNSLYFYNPAVRELLKLGFLFVFTEITDIWRHWRLLQDFWQKLWSDNVEHLRSHMKRWSDRSHSPGWRSQFQLLLYGSFVSPIFIFSMLLIQKSNMFVVPQ